MIKSFKELDVYQRAFNVSLLLHQKSLTFPKIEQYGLADQIRRASKSVCANIAEGFAKQKASKAEFKRFLLMAYGSAQEMLVWIDYCEKLNYTTEKESKEWENEYIIISKMLNNMHSKIL